MSEDEREEKDIVRGYNFAEYHADVYDKTESEVTGAGLDCECLGGGRIEHKPQEKYIKVLPKIRDVWNGHSHLLTSTLSRFMVIVWDLERQIMPAQWRSFRRNTKIIK